MDKVRIKPILEVILLKKNEIINMPNKYVLFPLHKEPEVQLLLHGAKYQNQFEFIKQVSDNLPDDVQLVVKEHPMAVGYRPVSYYKEISKIKNVIRYKNYVVIEDNGRKEKYDYVFFASSYNSSLFSLHGTLVCLGLILYSIGSKAIPAAELTLLSLTEVIGGIFWVWLPLFGINEIPTTNTIIGGFFLFVSLTYYSLVMRWNKRYIGLN